MALFQWRERPIRLGPVFGDERTVTRPVLLRKVGGEWRALGIERIVQEYGYWWHSEDRTYYRWADKEWADDA